MKYSIPRIVIIIISCIFSLIACVPWVFTFITYVLFTEAPESVLYVFVSFYVLVILSFGLLFVFQQQRKTLWLSSFFLISTILLITLI